MKTKDKLSKEVLDRLWNNAEDVGIYNQLFDELKWINDTFVGGAYDRMIVIKIEGRRAVLHDRIETISKRLEKKKGEKDDMDKK